MLSSLQYRKSLVVTLTVIFPIHVFAFNYLNGRTSTALALALGFGIAEFIRVDSRLRKQSLPQVTYWLSLLLGIFTLPYYLLVTRGFRRFLKFAAWGLGYFLLLFGAALCLEWAGIKVLNH